VASIFEINIHQQSALYCPVELECGGYIQSFPNALLDTGAGMCHITYPLWTLSGFGKLCWDENKKLMQLMKIKSSDDLTFDTLPLTAKYSELGDNSKAKVYEFKVDKLTLGKISIGFPHNITLNNITVRIIDSDKHGFLVGWNVLKYLAITYNPSISKATYKFALTPDGENYLHQDRINGINNHLNHRFTYLQH